MIVLRPETPDDQSAIFRVVSLAFDNESEAKLVDMIRQRNNSRLATVACSGELIVGYVVASPLTFEPSNSLACLGIAPVAVTPARQGEKIGSKLMFHVINLAREQNFDALFLLGSPSYYRRFGFRPTHIDNEYGAKDAFMALELRDGCLSEMKSLARYVGEFSEIGV